MQGIIEKILIFPPYFILLLTFGEFCDIIMMYAKIKPNLERVKK